MNLAILTCFNPLFIRSVFLLHCQEIERRFTTAKVSIPYSSGQCFFFPHREGHQVLPLVSIPYSSGQCFFSRGNPYLFGFANSFQSLIHQVSVSFKRTPFSIPKWKKGFNPLFIRSVFLFMGRRDSQGGGNVSIPYSSGQCFFCPGQRNSLYRTRRGVSIPYSSGQCFF